MRVWRSLMAVVSCAFACAASAQQPAGANYEPVPGQPGKDVVWVPMPDAQVEMMLDLAKVTAADFVVDLGSGDGRTVIAAARRSRSRAGSLPATGSASLPEAPSTAAEWTGTS